MADEEITANDTTVASAAGDFYCDLCKLDFSSNEELKEHTWTMLHHGKLNKAKGRDCVHECTLCEETFVELLSFTKHLHADTHQERYHAWKNQQRSKDWEALNQMRVPSSVPSRGEFSGKPSYQERTNNRHKRKNSNGKDVSFRTRHQFQKEARGEHFGHHHHQRKSKGNRKLRHFHEYGNSFPVDGSEMGHERDYALSNESMGSENRFGRNISGRKRSESSFFSHDLLSSFRRQSPETACSDNPANLPGHSSQSDSCWSNRLRSDRHQFSQNATEPKHFDQSFRKESSWRKQRGFSGSPDTSVFLGGVGEKASNGNGQPRSASPLMGVPSRSFVSDKMTSRLGRSRNEQINNSNIYSEFVPEKRRNSFGNRQNRTRYFRNRTWISDDFKSRAGENQKDSRYSTRKSGFSDSLSLEANDVHRENEISNKRSSVAFSRATEGHKPTLKDNQDLDDRDSRTNAQEAPGDVGMGFSPPIGEKNAEQRAYFTLGFPDPATGSPEEPRAEVIESEQISLSTKTRRLRDSDTKKDEDLGHSPKSLTDSHIEFPSNESKLASKAGKAAKPKATKSIVTETSSLRRTSPRLRRINLVTQSQNSDISSVVGSSEITDTVINAESKKRTLGNNSMLDEEVERLNALIKMKKEPSDPSENAETTTNPDYGKVQERQESTRGETSDAQTRCSFVHIDGVQCEALTSERYCSYHQRFPQGNLIKTEPGTAHEKAVLTNTTLLDSSLSSNVMPRDLTNDRDAVPRGDGVRMSNMIGTRRHSHSFEDLNNRNPDYEHSSTRTVIKRRGSENYESTPNRSPMKSAIYFHGMEQLSERMRSYGDAKAENSDDTPIPKASSNVEMMDLSMSTNFLVLPHSQVVTSSTVKPTVTSRSTSSWRSVGPQPRKDTVQSGYWNVSHANTMATSCSSSSVGQLRENTAPKWSSNTVVKTERQFDVPVSPASTPPSLSEPRRGSVSPVSPSVRKESSVSPLSASSVPSLDLSRLNLPPHVRRALALKYANRKQLEGATLASGLAPNLSSSRNRFVEAKKDHPSSQEQAETMVKQKPPVTSNVVRGRLRQQRSISLDSFPTSKTFYPDVPNSSGRIVPLPSYEGFATVKSIASGSRAFQVSSATATNANKSGTFSAQPMIDLSASNYIPSLHQSGASKERQNHKDHEATTTHRLVKSEVREFSSTTEDGVSLEKNKVYSHQRTSSLENIPFLPRGKRSVRAASFERDADYARSAGDSHPPQSSRLVPATGMIKKEGEQLAPGLQTSVSAALDKQSSHSKFATVFQGAPRSLIVTPLPSEKGERNTLQSDTRISRPIDQGTEHKDKDGGYISLESRARSVTPEGTSTNVGRLRQYGLLDLGSTSLKNDQPTRSASLQDRLTLNREPDREMSYPRSGDIVFPKVSNFKDGADSHDFAPSKRTTTDGSDSAEQSKRTKGDDSTKSENKLVNYLPGVDVKELLHLEHEEQKQLKSLQDVQAKAKATRLKLQALSIELEHLNVLEKKISEDISNTKNKRLEILQTALHGNREKSTSETLRTTVKSSAAGNTSSQLQKNVADVEQNNNVREANGFSSASDALGKSSTILVHDCNVESMQKERVNDDKTISSSAAPIQGNEDDVVVKTRMESTYPCEESSFTKEGQPLTTQDVIDRTDQSEDMETDHNVPRDPQAPAKDSGEIPSSLPVDKEEWVSEHFEKSRKEFFQKIKQQLSSPKKRQQHKKQRKRFSETKVSNSLAVSKERLELVRERMREWNGNGQRQSQPPSEQSVAAGTAFEALGHPSTSSTTKDTNLTPSKIPVRDVGDTTKKSTDELKKSNHSDLRDKSDVRVKLKSKINVKKKRKSLYPSKKAPSHPDAHVKAAADHTVPPKDKAKSSDERVLHSDGVDSLKKKPERKTKASKSLSTSKARASVFDGHTGAVCALKVSQGKLFTCSADKTTKAFDIQTGECIKQYKGHHHAVNCLEISDNGERLFTGSNDQTVRSYSIKTAVCTHKFTFDGRVMCLHIGFGLLYVGLSSGIVTLVDLTTNTCVERLRCHEPRAVSCLATATEGQRTLLCTGSFDATISVRDHKTGLLFKTLTGHSMTVLCMQVVDNVVYSGAADAKVVAHNLNTGELLRNYTGHTLSVSSLQVVGRVLVTSCLDKLIRCYDLMSAELLQAYGGQSDMIFSVHLSNGRIYSGTRDGKVSSFKLDLRVYHPCKWKDCQLNFGIVSHMKDHIKDFHIIQQGTIDKCLWADCTHAFSDSDNLEAILDHVDDHLKSIKSAT